MAMRTTSSMPPWLPTTIVSTQPAAVVGMGAPAQTQSARHLPASLRLRVLSSQAHRSLRSPCNCRSMCAAMCVRACMRVWLGLYVHSCERTRACVPVCLCVRACVRACAGHPQARVLWWAVVCLWCTVLFCVVLCCVVRVQVLVPVRARLDSWHPWMRTQTRKCVHARAWPLQSCNADRSTPSRTPSWRRPRSS